MTSGILFFVFTIGVLRWEPRAIALAMIVSFLYGSMLWGIFPVDPTVSFESHLLGAVLGVALAFALRWRDPPRPRRRYSWEDDEDEVRDAPSTGPRDVPRTSLAPGVWLRATPAARRAPPSRCGCTPA